MVPCWLGARVRFAMISDMVLATLMIPQLVSF